MAEWGRYLVAGVDYATIRARWEVGEIRVRVSDSFVLPREERTIYIWGNAENGECFREQAMEEAKQVLDQFPVGHAQFIQERLRAGLINGTSYGDSNQCPACFYGTLAYADGMHWSKEFYDRVFSQKPKSASELEQYFARLRVRMTPETDERAAEFDAFLSHYIQTRLLEAEANCPLTEVEDEVVEEVLIHA